MIYVVFIVFAVIVIFIININNTKSKEDANKQYFSESIKSYENFNPTYINTIVICIVYQHITYPYIKNSSTNSNLVDYAI